MRYGSSTPVEDEDDSPRRVLTLQHLLYLEALVEERSVTRAAERSGIGQPAMSNALSRMRQVLKDPLLIPTRGGMEPTLRAVDLARRSRELGAVLDGRADAQQPFILSESTAHWRILASDGIIKLLMAPVMTLAVNEAPRMRFAARPGDPRRVQEFLRDGEFDLAITFLRNPPPDLRQVMLPHQKLVCIARKGHPAIGSKLTLKQFLAQRHVRWGGPPSTYATFEAIVDEALGELNHARDVALTVPTLSLIAEMVGQSDMIGVVPEPAALLAPQQPPLQILRLPFKVPAVEISVIWHERLHRDPGHQWLRQAIIENGQRQLRAIQRV